MPRALAIAQQRAGIGKDTAVQVVVYPPKPTLFEALSETFGGSEEMRASLAGALLSPQERETLAAVRRPMRLLGRGESLALLPWVFARQ